ncbi:YdcH family protein [Luteimonas changyuni]|uniref:YdcH family protein n=1 Tax=Luteimonas sp. MJ145 TaxID=3129234 RepID=UPI0031BA6B5B
MDSPDTPEQSRLAQRLLVLKTEHRDLDVAISRLQLDPGADELLVKRLKKQKLQLRDCIERLESALIPDEPA